MKRDLVLFIEDIKDSIRKIDSFSEDLRRKFLQRRLRQSAIIREIEVVGEAVKNIPDSFREKYSNIQWKDFAGFRDVLSHAL